MSAKDRPPVFTSVQTENPTVALIIAAHNVAISYGEKAYPEQFAKLYRAIAEAVTPGSAAANRAESETTLDIEP